MKEITHEGQCSYLKEKTNKKSKKQEEIRVSDSTKPFSLSPLVKLKVWLFPSGPWIDTWSLLLWRCGRDYRMWCGWRNLGHWWSTPQEDTGALSFPLVLPPNRMTWVASSAISFYHYIQSFYWSKATGSSNHGPTVPKLSQIHSSSREPVFLVFCHGDGS